jgi:DNA-binding GntR family transcriptional regulator
VFGAATTGVEEHRHWSSAHAELLESFRARDVRGVRRSVRDHLAANERTLLEGIGAAGY